MLPRSRSPLLPSPTGAGRSICELDISCGSSQTSTRSTVPPLLPKPITKPFSLAKPVPPPAKPSKPAKPPRKSLETTHNREQVGIALS